VESQAPDPLTEREKKLENVLRLGQEMRRAQTEFFRLRSQELLIRSKELERQFDYEAVEVLDEPDLFG
jgi:hypothetical protein